ncbi:DUF1697 domain-containing protein [Herbiconiux solani]|uniref:DUF1697 domain-containing protein n=1 Tax=Herbiconiux solani TaxID=661329 RepID=UPI000826A4A4|nr:DUF1697 domain-containing protein [Herbiconiux solani]
MRYAALLRGVNVNGVTVKSAELAELFRSLGFAGVKTVLASGNVVFETADGDRPALKARIEKGLAERFGYDAWIVLVAHDDLAAIVDGYPFPETDETHPYVVFSSDAGVLDEVAETAAGLDPAAPGELGERAARGPDGLATRVVYWECPKGSSTDTVFAKYLAKARFKSTTTTRNLRTLRKLL